MSSIYLIRHGQASFGQEDYDLLSGLGQSQARRLGKSFKVRCLSFNKVVLGSMKRHKQTAEHCLAQLSKDTDLPTYEYDSRWNEYDHRDILSQLRPEFSSTEGVHRYIRSEPNPKEAFSTIFNEAMQRWISGAFEGYSESWLEYCDRITSALKDVTAAKYQGQDIALFTSGGPISIVALHVMGMPIEKLMDINWTLVNCGVTKLVATKSRVFLASLNEQAHFEIENDKTYITYK